MNERGRKKMLDFDPDIVAFLHLGWPLELYIRYGTLSPWYCHTLTYTSSQ